ncbi:hypothetical protein ARAM_001704 [Aspergillus rambellii]|uniref:AttH domain-containing protein n=1 Tax=Aspergillus rambellii TaxID=308745 RepID=A0A0F8VFB9_9EURO|nr:hypothetical protein ARAM_001704 [Aspergillus rambellii]
MYFNVQAIILALFIPTALGFVPDAVPPDVALYDQSLPLTWDLNTSQSMIEGVGNSWWCSSFIQASDGNQYFIVSHVAASGVGFYRYSILGITEPSFYESYAVLGSEADPISNHVRDSNITLPTYGFLALNASNPLQAMQTYSTHGAIFNVTFQFSSPILIDGGTGTFTWGPYQTYEWAMPAGITSGTLVVNGTELTIDPRNSLTWYDRQLVFNVTAHVPLQNWTWFEVHIDQPAAAGSRVMSIWIWDYGNQPRAQFATIRNSPGVHEVMPLTEFTPGGPTWTSSCSNITYPQSWRVALLDGTTFHIASLRAEQELCDPAAPLSPAYEGYMTFTGTEADGKPMEGYGLVEISRNV